MKALIIVGSPRKGTSWKLGQTMADCLTNAGVETQSIFAVKHLNESWPELERAADDADLIVLSFPLYVDTLPALLIDTLSRLKDKIADKKLAVVVNCGFPEGYHNATVLKVCKQFAREANCTWLGGLALKHGRVLLWQGAGQSGAQEHGIGC